MPKTIFIAPNDRVLSKSFAPPLGHVFYLPEAGAHAATKAFQRLAKLRDTVSCVLFVVPPSVAADMAGEINPLAPHIAGDGGRFQFECHQKTWAEVCQWKIPQPAPPTGKTLVLIPVPEKVSPDFWEDIRVEMTAQKLAPQAGFCLWGIDKTGLREFVSALKAEQNSGFHLVPCFGTIQYSYDEELHPTTLSYNAHVALWSVVQNHLSGQNPDRTWDGPEKQVRNGPLLGSIMLAVPPLLARAIANCLLPQDAQISPKAWDGTSFLALKLPFRTWAEMTPPSSTIYYDVLEGRAAILHHATRQAEPAPVAPTAAPETPARRIVLLTPAAWEGNAKEREKRGPFNTNAPKGQLTGDGKAALADVTNRLARQEIAPQIILASPAADATLTAHLLQDATRPKPFLERPTGLLPNHKDLSSVFDALTRPQQASTTTVFVVAAPADLARLTVLMGGEPQTFAPNADCRIAELYSDLPWSRVAKFAKNGLPPKPIKAYLPLT